MNKFYAYGSLGKVLDVIHKKAKFHEFKILLCVKYMPCQKVQVFVSSTTQIFEKLMLSFRRKLWSFDTVLTHFVHRAKGPGFKTLNHTNSNVKIFNIDLYKKIFFFLLNLS